MRRGLFIVAGAVVAVAVVAIAVYSLAQPLSTPASGPLSRQVMAYAEQEVIAHREPPTLAALHYAYIASAYADALDASDQAGALMAARSLSVAIFPTDEAKILEHFQQLAITNQVAGYSPGSSAQKSQVTHIIKRYVDRYASDGHLLAWDSVIPTGTGKWHSNTGQPPITPRAGDWKRWVVTTPIVVPAPPVVGSPEDNRQLNIVRQAVAARTGDDIRIINLWAGSIGSETPSGLWQNQLFANVKHDLPKNALAADKSYALIQKNLSQATSDAFMECWKVKYTYWTARPDQRMPGLDTAMPDPNFPSYISGHSTVSKAAADVLSIMAPRYAAKWEAMAREARNSRLVSGIHFDVDNSVGFDVGTNVAGQAVASLHLAREL